MHKIQRYIFKETIWAWKLETYINVDIARCEIHFCHYHDFILNTEQAQGESSLLAAKGKMYFV